MKVSFNGLLDAVATFETRTTVNKGDLVMMTSSGIVASCSEGQAPIGIAVGVEDDGCVAVQLKGYIEAEYTGISPTVGYGSVVAGTDSTKLAVAGDEETGADVLIVTVDSTNQIMGIIL